MDIKTKSATRHLTEALAKIQDGDLALAYKAANTATLQIMIAMGAEADTLATGYEANTPMGFETVVAFIARTTPTLFQHMDLAAVVEEDEPKLRALCARLDTVVLTGVPSPKPLLDAGLPQCFAFPVHVLRTFYNHT